MKAYSDSVLAVDNLVAMLTTFRRMAAWGEDYSDVELCLKEANKLRLMIQGLHSVRTKAVNDPVNDFEDNYTLAFDPAAYASNMNMYISSDEDGE